jgi:hypothetical protein
LIVEAATATIRPMPTASNGCGFNNRLIAAAAMKIAATTISTPSMPLEKYSALLWPCA